MCGLLWWPGGGRPGLGPSLVRPFLEEVASEVEVEGSSGVEDTFLLEVRDFAAVEVVEEEATKLEVMVEDEAQEEDFVEEQGFLMVAEGQEEW